jgi:DNA-binding NtrC family response regulator
MTGPRTGTLNVLIVSNEAGRLFELFEKNSSVSASSRGGQPGRHDIAFLDLDMEGWGEKLLELRHLMPVIAFSESDLRKAVEAVRLGASDYLEKPLTASALGEVIERHKGRMLSSKYGFEEFIGSSPSMKEVFGVIRKAAASESNVLVTGESGTGKELVARAIHRWSPRSEEEFITINCSAIPDTLLESELFGFEKGAFTGANYTKKGLLELADRGTVFFDEIGDVSQVFQTKVLRVLQEGEFIRVGGTRQTKIDVRVIAATNRDLKSACQKGVFREDLFYRLNVINIHIPPLRERMDDVPLLAGHFLRKHAAKRKNVLVKDISKEAMEVLMAYPFPGNVRELENIMERAISFASGPEITPAELPPHLLQCPIRGRAGTARLKEALEGLERDLITTALRDAGGNISRAAASLGIYRQHLQRKIKALRIAT